MKNIKLDKTEAVNYLLIFVGSLIYAVGQLIFIKSMRIPMGGIAGITLVLNYLWQLPIGVMNIVLNIPLFIMGYKGLGREFFYKTVFCTVISSICLDVAERFLPVYDGDMLLSALYGGIVMGLGFGMIFRAGGTSGGTDVLSKYLNKKKDIQIGSVNFAVNAIIIVTGALVYQNIESALYAIITSYISSMVIDKMVFGVDVQKEAIIITQKPKEVADIIMSTLGRGVTAIEGKGMYTGDDKTVLICAVRRFETGTLKRILHQADDHAFVMLSQLSEVFGQGFKKYEE